MYSILISKLVLTSWYLAYNQFCPATVHMTNQFISDEFPSEAHAHIAIATDREPRCFTQKYCYPALENLFPSSIKSV